MRLPILDSEKGIYKIEKNDQQKFKGIKTAVNELTFYHKMLSKLEMVTGHQKTNKIPLLILHPSICCDCFFITHFHTVFSRLKRSQYFDQAASNLNCFR